MEIAMAIILHKFGNFRSLTKDFAPENKDLQKCLSSL
jgi:hypothetical protein